MKNASSIDVARAAGVSQSTVSRTFSDGANVSPEKRARVLEAAKELGYRPNAIARSMITDRTNIVGIVMPHITSPFYPQVLKLFTRKLAEMDIQVMFFHVYLEEELTRTLPRALQYQVDALVITSITLSSALVDECLNYGTPVILFNRYTYEANASAVCCDNVLGGRDAADLLLNAGHSRFAYVAGETNASTSRDREQGFTERMRQAGVTDFLRETGDFTYQSGYQAGVSLLNRADRPDAVFCANDLMAMGLMDAARYEAGLRIPDDLSVVGFDNTDPTGWRPYNLTTFEQPLDTMIDATIELLMERVEDHDIEPVRRFFPAALIDRGSIRSAGQ